MPTDHVRKTLQDAFDTATIAVTYYTTSIEASEKALAHYRAKLVEAQEQAAQLQATLDALPPEKPA
jgi:hypothetical protein